MSRRLYPQQQGSNNNPGQFPPTSYSQNVAPGSYPPAPRGVGPSGGANQFPQTVSPPISGISGAIQQMQIRPPGQVGGQRAPSHQWHSAQAPPSSNPSVPSQPPHASLSQPPTIGQQIAPPAQQMYTPPSNQTLRSQGNPMAGPPTSAGQNIQVSNPSLQPPPRPGQLHQATPPLSTQPPPRPTMGQAPPTSMGQNLRQPMPISNLMSSGAQVQLQANVGLNSRPPDPSGGGYNGPPPPGSSGQTGPLSNTGLSLPPPPMVGQTYQPPLQRIGPPLPGSSGQPEPSLPPPPMVGQSYQPLQQTGPPPSGSVGQPGPSLPPPPMAGHTHQPPPVSHANPTSQMQMAGPMGSGHLGQRPLAQGNVLSGPAPGPGRPTPLSGPAAAVMNDPNLQPVNMMESRDILPSTPVEPPSADLPGNKSKYCPHPSVFCCTMNAIPATSGMLNKMKLPLAINIHPFKDISNNECPVLHPSIIVRCRMCRTYINPFVTFIDSRHWRCNLCFRANSLPEDFDFNQQTGKHSDRSHRVELKRSSVEYIAPSEYMVRPPQPSVYYFVIDVSFNTIDTGLLGVICQTLLENLDRLPGDARTMIGVLTFDSTLHFYNLSPSLSQPQMLVVSELDDVFLPSPDYLLVNLKESKELVRTLLEDLPKMFASNRSVQCALGPALQAAYKLLHPIGGRVSVFVSTLPNIGPGALKHREISPGSMKMDSLNMSPVADFYKKLALECSSQQIGVDLFIFSSQFTDLPTISCIAKFSAGQVLYYPDFHHSKEIPRQKFERDLKRYLTRKIGYEAVMRIRCTDGLSLHTFHGNFFVRSTDLLSLPIVNPDHGYTINIAIDDNLKEISTVCFQAALLYTSSKGERRIRVHTLCIPVATQLPQVYAKLNIHAITGVLANMAVDRSASATLGDAREALMNVTVDAAKVYRSNCCSSQQSSQFVLPSSIRLLPLYVLSLVKHPAFTLSTTVPYDARAQAMNLIKALPLDYIICSVYPRLYALHLLSEKDVSTSKDGSEVISPPILRLSAEKMTRYGIFLMDYGLGMYVWVCKDAPQDLIQSVFGLPHFGAIPEIMTTLPVLENESSHLILKLLNQIRISRQHFMPLQVIREDGPERLLFIEKLTEDRTEHGTSSYELLTHLNRQLVK